MGADVDEVLSPDEQEEDDLGLVDEEGSKIIYPEETFCSSIHETYKDSPFFKIFDEVYEEAMEVVRNDMSDSKKFDPNPLHVPQFADYFKKHLGPFLPFWNLYIQSLLFPHYENPKSNSCIELMQRLDKVEGLDGKTHQEPLEVATQLIEDVEKRILEAQYNPNFKRYIKKDKGKMETDELPVQKPAVEKFKGYKRKSRPPGGLFSKRRVGVFASTLRLKIDKASKHQGKKLKIKKKISRKQKPLSDEEEDKSDTDATSASPPQPTPRDSSPSVSPISSSGNQEGQVTPGAHAFPPGNHGDRDITSQSPHNRRLSLSNVRPSINEVRAPWREDLSCSSDGQLNEEDLQSLHPGRYLTDVVIMKFLEKRLIDAKDRHLNFIIFPVSVIRLLDVKDEFLSLMRRLQVMTSDVWIIPLHDAEGASHFTLMLIIFKRNTILVLDSLGKASTIDVAKQVLTSVLGGMSVLHWEVYRCDPDWSQWKIYLPLDTPQQPCGSSECGPMVCLYADAVLGGTNTLPDKSEFPLVRQWIRCVATGHTSTIEDLNATYHRRATFEDALAQVHQMPVLQTCPPGASSTWVYLQKIHLNLYEANSRFCKVPGCHMPAETLMVYCIGLKCRDWVHLKCVQDSRRASSLPSNYRCPSCLQPTKKKL